MSPTKDAAAPPAATAADHDEEAEDLSSSRGSSPDVGDAPTGGAKRPLDTTLQTPVDGETVSASKRYLLVTWDLDTTGRRLIDEICQVGGNFLIPKDQMHKFKVEEKKKKPGKKAAKKEKEEKAAPKEDDAEAKEEPKPAAANEEEEEDDEDEPSAVTCASGSTFSQYVMPYKNPNPGARRSFGIRVVNIGRYRMLKDVETGKILKTKSEMSALQEFINWMSDGCTKLELDGVILACHEPTRKVLIPLLLGALVKYNLMESFSAVVAGFANGVNIVKKFGDMSKVTSFSLRSLCKTLLADTSPATASASDRCRVLSQILAKLTDNASPAKLAEVSYTVESEVRDLEYLKGMLGTQGTLRPIFEGELRQKRIVREKAMVLRKKVAESGLDYKALKDIFQTESPPMKESLLKKVSGATDDDVDQLAVLLEAHFNAPDPPKHEASLAGDGFEHHGAAPVENGGAPSHRGGGYNKYHGGSHYHHNQHHHQGYHNNYHHQQGYHAQQQYHYSNQQYRGGNSHYHPRGGGYHSGGYNGYNAYSNGYNGYPNQRYQRGGGGGYRGNAGYQPRGGYRGGRGNGGYQPRGGRGTYQPRGARGGAPRGAPRGGRGKPFKEAAGVAVAEAAAGASEC